MLQVEACHEYLEAFSLQILDCCCPVPAVMMLLSTLLLSPFSSSLLLEMPLYIGLLTRSQRISQTLSHLVLLRCF